MVGGSSFSEGHVCSLNGYESAKKERYPEGKEEMALTTRGSFIEGHVAAESSCQSFCSLQRVWR